VTICKLIFAVTVLYTEEHNFANIQTKLIAQLTLYFKNIKVPIS